jgi:hypothetical protein
MMIEIVVTNRTKSTFYLLYLPKVRGSQGVSEILPSKRNKGIAPYYCPTVNQNLLTQVGDGQEVLFVPKYLLCSLFQQQPQQHRYYSTFSS